MADCTAAAIAIATGQHGLDIDSSGFALAGDSAGANLALGALLGLREAGAKASAAALFYGNYNMLMSSGSFKRYGRGYGLETADVAWFWEQYLGTNYLDNPRAEANLLEHDLVGLPPLFVAAAECDPISDESRMLSARLEAARTPHHFRLWKGTIHGCIGMSRELNQAQAQLAESAAWLNNRLRDSSLEN